MKSFSLALVVCLVVASPAVADDAAANDVAADDVVVSLHCVILKDAPTEELRRNVEAAIPENVPNRFVVIEQAIVDALRTEAGVQHEFTLIIHAAPGQFVRQRIESKGLWSEARVRVNSADDKNCQLHLSWATAFVGSNQKATAMNSYKPKTYFNYQEGFRRLSAMSAEGAFHMVIRAKVRKANDNDRELRIPQDLVHQKHRELSKTEKDDRVSLK